MAEALEQSLKRRWVPLRQMPGFNSLDFRGIIGNLRQLNDKARRLLAHASQGSGRIVVITGAGISAESGIPTFRGSEGYWKVGSEHYHPQELATLSAFRSLPREVWSWYLYRRGVCSRAEPNAAHHALVRLEQYLGERFTLVTQNVDGLHGRAGSSGRQTYEVHGNVRFLRFDDAGTSDPQPISDQLSLDWDHGRQITERELDYLRHPLGSLGRPHILWFDEYYDEAKYRYDSALQAAKEADLLIVVGSSGSTNLPVQMADYVCQKNIPFVVVNKDTDSTFVELAEYTPNGVAIIGTAVEWVPTIVEQLVAG